MYDEEEMDKIVEACSKFRQAKLQTEMEQLRKELEENSESMPQSEKPPDEQSHEEDKPKPDECGTKDKCLKYGYQWAPETGCGYPDKTPSEKPGEQPES